MSNKKRADVFRFNLIDVLLILLILGAAAYLYLVLHPGTVSDPSARTEAVELVLTQDRLPAEFKGKVSIGDTLRSAATGEIIGEVIGISYGESTYLGTDPATGEQVASPYPGTVRMELTVRAETVFADGLRTAGGTQLSVGVGFNYRVPHLFGTAVCTDLRVTESAA